MNKFHFIFDVEPIKKHKSSKKSIFEKRGLDVFKFVQEQFEIIERYDEKVVQVEMNDVEYNFIKRYFLNQREPNDVDFLFPTLLQKNHGHLFGAEIIMNKNFIGITFIGKNGTTNVFV